MNLKYPQESCPLQMPQLALWDPATNRPNYGTPITVSTDQMRYSPGLYLLF
jgi:hypothetical protein